MSAVLSKKRVAQLVESIRAGHRCADELLCEFPNASRSDYLKGWLGGELVGLVRELAGDAAGDAVQDAVRGSSDESASVEAVAS